MFDTAYLFQDRDPASVEVAPDLCPLWIDSQGQTLQGLCLRPGGAAGERHPTAVLLHGFPGLEQSRDLAQALRRSGMVSILFHYRGCWGSRGDYRLSHLPEDLSAVLDYLRAHAEELTIDPERIYLMGHSMGSFVTLNALSHGEAVRGAVCMAPCDVSSMYNLDRPAFEKLVSGKEAFFTMDSMQVLYKDCAAHEADWPFPALAQSVDPQLPLLMIGGTRDVTTPPEFHIEPMLSVLRAKGARADFRTLPSNHTFDSHRIALIRMVADWIAALEP